MRQTLLLAGVACSGGWLPFLALAGLLSLRALVRRMREQLNGWIPDGLEAR